MDNYTGRVNNTHCRHGWGTCLLLNGSVYTGSWLNDEMDGFGRLTFPCKNEYMGNWCCGSQNGFGVLRYADGYVYTGNWVGSRQDGLGTLTLRDIEVYRGDWHHGMRHGFGVSRHIDNSNVYSGEWNRGGREGVGTMVYTERGYSYEGNWKDGEPVGDGVVLWNSGERLVGQWRGCEQLMCGTNNSLHMVNGDVYTGTFTRGFLHGCGTVQYANGDLFTGWFLSEVTCSVCSNMTKCICAARVHAWFDRVSSLEGTLTVSDNSPQKSSQWSTSQQSEWERPRLSVDGHWVRGDELSCKARTSRGEKVSEPNAF